MSLFGSLLGELDDDSIFGHHMRSMRQMNNIMGSLMPDPFGMLSPFDTGLGGGHSALTGVGHRNTSLMPFGFQSMPNINRLLGGDFVDAGGNPGTSYCSSSFVSMTQGPDGRPQVYQASSSSKSGPGGIRETRKTVQDSRTGVKKMAIGHHIGERAHIIEREQNLRNGQNEERQDYINLDEEEVEDFDKEFTNKARSNVRNVGGLAAIESGNRTHGNYRQTNLPAITAPPSVHPHPYNPSAARRNHHHQRSKKISSSQINNSSPNEN